LLWLTLENEWNKERTKEKGKKKKNGASAPT